MGPRGLCPHADEVLVLADGRQLAWAEWGDPRGAPLVLCHPWSGSRLLCPDPAAAAAAGIRLVTVDRPGYGRSDPVADPTLAGFARDLERLLDHIWVGQFGLVGWSAGGQYAAACAALLVERVTAVALVATPAPDHQVRWLTPSFRAVAARAAGDPRRALSAAARLGTPPGAVPEWAPGAGASGLAADVVAASRPWEFVPSGVRARTALFYGEDDAVIGAAHGRWWARTMPEAELSFLPGSGQLLPFTAWAEILQAAAS